MRRLFLVAFLWCLSSSCALSESGRVRQYQVGDMDLLLQDYYTNDLGRTNPGLACGDFKSNNYVGCFQLVTDPAARGVSELIYRDLSSGEIVHVYKFDPPADDVFIEKIVETRLVTSGALPDHEEVILEQGQPSLRLVFFEKSAVVFYWKNGGFRSIWTAD